MDAFDSTKVNADVVGTQLESIGISPDEAIAVIQLSRLLNLDKISTQCEGIIQTAIDMDNVLYIRELATATASAQLHEYCNAFIYDNMVEACTSETFISEVDLEYLNNHRTNTCGDTMIIQMAYLGAVEMVQLVVERGGDVNQANDDGLTPLHAAIIRYCGVVINMYLTYGKGSQCYSRVLIGPWSRSKSP